MTTDCMTSTPSGYVQYRLVYYINIVVANFWQMKNEWYHFYACGNMDKLYMNVRPMLVVDKTRP